MNNQRIFRHVTTGGWHLRRAFSKAALRRIEAAIRAAEATHDGQIRFAVETALDLPALIQGVSAHERAVETFSKLRVWDTEHNNGVLIYLLMADHEVEIVADRGVHRQAGETVWQAICQKMEMLFREKRFEEGIILGIQEVGRVLSRFYPKTGHGKNELPDTPVIL